MSSKRAALESKQELLRRIDEAARVLPLEQLALSPQCGFASTMEGNVLPRPTSGPSCNWWSRRPAKCGIEDGVMLVQERAL